MCGRVILRADERTIRNDLREAFKHDLDPNREMADESTARRRTWDFRENWNAPPTSHLPVVRFKNGRLLLEEMRWGLIPAWSKDGQVGSTFNARAETLREKPTFRDPWRKGQRCLIVIGGFYEWRKRDKQAHAVMMADQGLMAIAGLWEEWVSPDGEIISTCTVITTEANKVMAEVHDRMPVILDKADWPKWVGEVAATEDELYALLKPAPIDRVKIWPVDNRVGNVRINEPRLIEEIKPIGLLL
jgi:putative SOS response-associated peptidase YedK